jgi:Cu/Ag efflux protein CusF
VKNMIKVLVIALTSLAFSGVSFAQAKPATPATPATPAAPAMEKSEKAKSNRATGEVTSVDMKAGTFTVKAKDKEINLVADSSTKAALEKLKVGDMVRVSYTEKDGKMIASSVKAESKSKAAKPDKAVEKKGEMTEKKSETK